jgi:uncharacterized protein YndB with AHSA1/START domain
MSAVASGLDHMTLDITEEIRVQAPIDKAFAALLEELGPANRGYQDAPMPMMLEPWPGGRWFRDLGNGNGHLWGHVQAVKAPSLLEITGPLWMSFPVASNVQYRLKEENGGTLITLKHSAFGLFPDGYGAPASQGWKNIFNRVRQRLEAA